MSPVTIREATAADIPALARLHVTTWNATYAPMGMKGPPVAVRERQWREKFASDDPAFFCYVVEDARGEPVGFAQANRSDNPDYEGELNKIYLLREYQRQGLGRRLVGHVARRFLAQGITSMWLYGDRAIHPASRGWSSARSRRTTTRATATTAGRTCAGWRRSARSRGQPHRRLDPDGSRHEGVC